ncbi:hypothetical protein TREMEDRAFT_63540 [Tremella mesenterica DSM 1558]|uniref:uncharacterized protein n=1 Tax=Tremella mesenterica (strain ATCC 24925 / CBS 8224 / DSM 1558 / NBRC 9311 / NRRL Y-6157 / RJB 2259-6 / UBC 559-6) TaxID=578456 RepID=UPI0003F49CF8|nr:uncharacterized protein TREMEDRAFT_63540 [Tremella mesenterica DSM 1558]EIW68372.1 hypothetical protein TREMEDRAFT_63540 [Tremella mesenterica DSM 1558]
MSSLTPDQLVDILNSSSALESILDGNMPKAIENSLNEPALRALEMYSSGNPLQDPLHHNFVRGIGPELQDSHVIRTAQGLTTPETIKRYFDGIISQHPMDLQEMMENSEAGKLTVISQDGSIEVWGNDNMTKELSVVFPDETIYIEKREDPDVIYRELVKWGCSLITTTEPNAISVEVTKDGKKLYSDGMSSGIAFVHSEGMVGQNKVTYDWSTCPGVSVDSKDEPDVKAKLSMQGNPILRYEMMEGRRRFVSYILGERGASSGTSGGDCSSVNGSNIQRSVPTKKAEKPDKTELSYQELEDGGVLVQTRKKGVSDPEITLTDKGGAQDIILQLNGGSLGYFTRQDDGGVDTLTVLVVYDDEQGVLAEWKIDSTRGEGESDSEVDDELESPQDPRIDTYLGATDSSATKTAWEDSLGFVIPKGRPTVALDRSSIIPVTTDLEAYLKFDGTRLARWANEIEM